MKKYILLGEIMGIGGWQLYNDARVLYEKKQGYQVFVIGYKSFEDEIVKLSALKETRALIRDEYSLPPYVFSKRQIKKIVDDVRIFIDYCVEDEVIVESTSIPYSLWGEILAENLNAYHFAYILHSHIDKKFQRRDLQEFYEFKYNQGLLAGMASTTVKEMFNEYSSVVIDKDNWIPASWRNPLSDNNILPEKVGYIKRMKKSGYFAIGYFGTLNKPHFAKICHELFLYVKKHPNRKILFVSIGSSKNGISENEQYLLTKKTKSICVLNIPEMYPVPCNLFSELDCCIASWGSSVVAARSGVLTIRLENDTNTLVQGVIGYGSLTKWPYSTCESEQLLLEEVIDRIYIGDYYNIEKYVPPIPAKDHNEAQDREQLFLNNAISKIEVLVYYNVMRIKCNNLAEFTKKILYHLIGKEAGEEIRRCMRKIRNLKKDRKDG